MLNSLSQSMFVFDLANNHQGDRAHGLRVIEELSRVIASLPVQACMKFQMRDLDSFIHPEWKGRQDQKMINRFESTRLEWSVFKEFRDVSKELGMSTMCTPFDERSVERIVEMQFDAIKIASCSATDWPLIERISEANLPVIFSTGGLQLSQVDDLVSFFSHKGIEFAIMHCVSIYPTPCDQFYLNTLDEFSTRYPGITIGWSTHEEPDELNAATIAVAKGAKIFERHVGMPTAKSPLNDYSSTPEQIDRWIRHVLQIDGMLGPMNGRPLPDTEKADLDKLRRGVFALDPIEAGSVIRSKDVFFAIPWQPGQLYSGEFREGCVAQVDLAAGKLIQREHITPPEQEVWAPLKKCVHEIKGMLNIAGIKLGAEFELEFSHHAGVENFSEIGATIINCINKQYCKKIIVMLPKQHHPKHCHKLKTESFQVLYGSLDIELDGHAHTLTAGDVIHVQAGVWHEFSSSSGCIFEEISTTHFNDDSFYADKRINKQERRLRKTVVNNWGRFELIERLK